MVILNHIYKKLKKIFEVLGFDLIILKRDKKNQNYEVISPIATYAPWLSDKSFNEIYRVVRELVST